MAKKSRSRKAAQPRHGARGLGGVSPAAHEAAVAVINEITRNHKVEILNFQGEAELYLDGKCVMVEIPLALVGKLETILAVVGAETHSFAVLIHDHTNLTRD